MLAINSVVERQGLIEEIYLELEALLLGSRESIDDAEEEEIETSDEENVIIIGKEANGQKRKTSRKTKNFEELAIFPRNSRDWSNLPPQESTKLKSKLLELLEQKRLLLIQGISDIDRIVAENSIE